MRPDREVHAGGPGSAAVGQGAPRFSQGVFITAEALFGVFIQLHAPLPAWTLSTARKPSALLAEARDDGCSGCNTLHIVTPYQDACFL